MTSDAPDAGLSVCIELLDPSQGHSVVTWNFLGKSVLTIGRLPDQDIPISDLHVSRTHALLRFVDNRWRVFSLGRHGVYVEGAKVDDFQLPNASIFQLGLGGPTLRFTNGCPASNDSGRYATMSFDGALVDTLRIDEAKKQADVGEIVEGEFFRSLKDRVAELRKR